MELLQTTEGKALQRISQRLTTQISVTHGLFAEIVATKIASEVLECDDEILNFRRGGYDMASNYIMLEIAKIAETSEAVDGAFRAAKSIQKNINAVTKHKSPLSGQLTNLDTRIGTFLQFLEKDPRLERCKIVRDKVLAHMDSEGQGEAHWSHALPFSLQKEVLTELGGFIGFLGLLVGEVSVETPRDCIFFYERSFNDLGSVMASHLAFDIGQRLTNQGVLEIRVELLKKLHAFEVGSHKLMPTTNLFEAGRNFLTDM